VSALTRVSRLDVGTTTAATNLGLTFRHCYYPVQSSYHDGEIARFGPGRAHRHELLRHAIKRGFHKFDVTIGDEPYHRRGAFSTRHPPSIRGNGEADQKRPDQRQGPISFAV